MNLTAALAYARIDGVVTINQLLVASFLHDGNPKSQKAISKATEITLQGIGQISDRLVTLGLAKKFKQPGRTKNLVQLTPKGIALVNLKPTQQSPVPCPSPSPSPSPTSGSHPTTAPADAGESWQKPAK